jgi:hypothetical protein
LIVVSANVVDIVAFAFRSLQVNVSPMRRGLGMMTNAPNLCTLVRDCPRTAWMHQPGVNDYRNFSNDMR